MHVVDTQQTPRWRIRPGRRERTFPGLVCLVGLLLLVYGGTPRTAEAVFCAKRYVAGGDHIPAGHEVEEEERYPSQLLDNHLLVSPGPWCVYNTAQNEATSSTYISGGQLATTWNMRPDLITLTVGGENPRIVNAITSCFDKVKDHDFTGATICASEILADASAWTQLANNLTTIFQQYRMIMAGRPKLVVAVTTYPNPYPPAASATLNVPLLCLPLIDTIPTCTARWLQLSPALLALDNVIQKLNSTIATAVQPFTLGSQGRFVLVDVYSKFQSHCMKMDVTIKTTVEHPEQQGAVHQHDSSRDFGCSTPWFVEGSTGTATPNYLDPAAIGVLINKSQTTEGMGIHPNEAGHQCIADLIWEADTIEPGLTPLKWKLGVAEAPNSNICQ